MSIEFPKPQPNTPEGAMSSEPLKAEEARRNLASLIEKVAAATKSYDDALLAQENIRETKPESAEALEAAKVVRQRFDALCDQEVDVAVVRAQIEGESR